MNLCPGSGSGFDNLFKVIASKNNPMMGLIIIALILSSIMYFLLTVYLEAILPSNHGVRKPWYFLCQVQKTKNMTIFAYLLTCAICLGIILEDKKG
jgi:uncharacterized membrane protein